MTPPRYNGAMKLPVLLLAGAVACGGDDKIHHLPDAPPARLIVEPADLSVAILNDVAVAQAYTARITDDHGNEVDVTAETAFSLHDATYGAFTGATLSVTGQGAGPTRVEATARGVTGDTGLVVFVKKTIVDPALPAAPDLFGLATEDAALAPKIVYPLDSILVPPNLGQFDVHWNNNLANTDNLFEVTMANQYVDVRLYTPGTANGTPYWTVFPPDTWYPIASSRQQLTLRVAGLDTTRPATKGTAAVQHVDVTNENTQGGIYYWTTSGGSIIRYDVAKPNVAPAPYFPGNVPPPTVNCIGCHTLSRDGTKMAVTFDGGHGRGTIYNVADRTALIPFDGTTQPALRWDFATFDAQASRVVTVEESQLYLRALEGAKLAGPLVPVTAGSLATHPEISPDNTRLVNVEFTAGYDADASNGSLVIRSFDAANNSFGAPTTLVPSAVNAANWYPSFSPDSQWIVFTRTNTNSYNNPSAETWLIKADGTQAPIQLATANLTGDLTSDLTGDLTNSWARWVPFGQTFGPNNEPMFYLTFSSKRAFGVRLPTVGRPQIWMTPVFPSRAAAGRDPSGNAFRVPFQDVATSNHIAQWTQAVITQ
jgi:hypothetical protein